VRDARIEEDALGRRRLAGVDVRHDSDVPATIQRCSACHGLVSRLRAFTRGIEALSQKQKIYRQVKNKKLC
jgi:hypothetical protein